MSARNRLSKHGIWWENPGCWEEIPSGNYRLKGSWTWRRNRKGIMCVICVQSKCPWFKSGVESEAKKGCHCSWFVLLTNCQWGLVSKNVKASIFCWWQANSLPRAFRKRQRTVIENSATKVKLISPSNTNILDKYVRLPKLFLQSQWVSNTDITVQQLKRVNGKIHKIHSWFKIQEIGKVGPFPPFFLVI